MDTQNIPPSLVLDSYQIDRLKQAYELTEIEIRTYVRLNYKYRKNAKALLHKLLTK